MTMVKTSRVPSGYYSGSEAAKRLGIGLSTFYYQVKTRKIHKYPDDASSRSEGYYSKKEIDRMAQNKELIILMESIEPVTFTRAMTEDDVRGIVDMSVAIYGQGGTPSYEARLAIWRKNPDVYYIVKQEDIVVGYISMIWFSDESVTIIMGPTPESKQETSAGKGIYSVMGAENVMPFTTGEPIDSLFISLAVRPGITNSEQRIYSLRLLRDAQDVLEHFADRGMQVRKLLATSEKGDGLRLARKLGMREIKYSGDPLSRFELDLATSTSFMARRYREYINSL